MQATVLLVFAALCWSQVGGIPRDEFFLAGTTRPSQTLSKGDARSSGAVDLGDSFVFFGQSRTTIYVSSAAIVVLFLQAARTPLCIAKASVSTQTTSGQKNPLVPLLQTTATTKPPALTSYPLLHAGQHWWPPVIRCPCDSRHPSTFSIR